jgi:hypothetical protein
MHIYFSFPLWMLHALRISQPFISSPQRVLNRTNYETPRNASLQPPVSILPVFDYNILLNAHRKKERNLRMYETCGVKSVRKLTQDMDHWWALVNMAMNHQTPQTVENITDQRSDHQPLKNAAPWIMSVILLSSDRQSKYSNVKYFLFILEPQLTLSIRIYTFKRHVYQWHDSQRRLLIHRALLGLE